VQTRVLGAFKDYLQAYLTLVASSAAISDRQQLTAIEKAQLAYINYRAAKDPARGMFTRLYGQEWTEEYIHGFLFDLERQLAIIG
jgi:phycoerythrobilin:ferredoxin oxidoreductase